MTELGKKFFIPFETLKNEKLIWEGGPSTRSFGAEFFAVFTAWLTLFLFFWIFVTMIVFVSSTEKDCSRCDKNNSEISQQKETSREAPPASKKKERFNFPTQKFLTATIACLLSLFLVVFVIAKIRLKTYWYAITNERVCIQQGLLEKRIVTIDLDKTISIKISQSIVERILSLNSIELIHGGLQFNNNVYGRIQSPNILKYLDVNDQVSSSLINEWLPRDNKDA